MSRLQTEGDGVWESRKQLLERAIAAEATARRDIECIRILLRKTTDTTGTKVQVCAGD
jgi:hypothetical protein